MFDLLAALTPNLGSAPSEEWAKLIAVSGGLLIGLVAVIGSFTRSILVARAREHSRREIAAYIAEGSMSTEDGAKLLEAGRPAWEQCRSKRNA